MLKVIFVDDEEKVLRGLRNNLRKMRDAWDMDFVTSGQEALEMFADKNYDIIVSDMMMPKMSGEELLSTIQKDYPQAKRIILSGHCDQMTAFRLVGSDHFYLSKPCPIELLIDTIKTASHLGKSVDDAEISAVDVKDALCEFVQLLLMRGDIRMNVVPDQIKAWLPEKTLETFAPFVGDYKTFFESSHFSPQHDSSEKQPDEDVNGWDDYFDKK